MTHNFALERIAGRIFAAFWWVPESEHSSRSAWGVEGGLSSVPGPSQAPTGHDRPLVPRYSLSESGRP